MTRYGMTIPLDGIPLAQQRDWIRELADLGYTDLWSAEAGATDAFTRSRSPRSGRPSARSAARSSPPTRAGRRCSR
jgi:hypothetical protein